MTDKLLLVAMGDGSLLKDGALVHGHNAQGECLPKVKVLAMYPSLNSLLLENPGGARFCAAPLAVDCIFMTPADYEDVSARIATTHCTKPPETKH